MSKLQHSKAAAGWTRIAYIGQTRKGPAPVHWDDGWKDNDNEPAKYLGIAKIGTIWVWTDSK